MNLKRLSLLVIIFCLLLSVNSFSSDEKKSSVSDFGRNESYVSEIQHVVRTNFKEYLLALATAKNYLANIEEIPGTTSKNLDDSNAFILNATIDCIKTVRPRYDGKQALKEYEGFIATAEHSLNQSKIEPFEITESTNPLVPIVKYVINLFRINKQSNEKESNETCYIEYLMRYLWKITMLDIINEINDIRRSWRESWGHDYDLLPKLETRSFFSYGTFSTVDFIEYFNSVFEDYKWTTNFKIENVETKDYNGILGSKKIIYINPREVNNGPQKLFF